MYIFFEVRDEVRYVNPALGIKRQAQRITFKTDLVQLDICIHYPYFVGSTLWSNLLVDSQKSHLNSHSNIDDEADILIQN